MRRSAAAILASVLATPATASDAAPACTGPAYELAQRFTGAWQEFAVTEEGEQLGGRLEVTLEAGGCALAQVFTGADVMFSFRSLGYVETATGQRLQTLAPNSGSGRAQLYRVGDAVTAAWRHDAGHFVAS